MSDLASGGPAGAPRRDAGQTRRLAWACTLALATAIGQATGPRAAVGRGPWRPEAGSSAGATIAQQSRPELTIQSRVVATAGSRTALRVRYDGHGAAVTSVVFSIDYDETLLAIDPTDADSDGNPDSVKLTAPAAFMASATLDAADRDGELDVVVADLALPLATVPDGDLVEVTFDVGRPPAEVEARVAFSDDPAPSFGDLRGRSVQGDGHDGSVLVSVPTWRAYLPVLESR